MAILFASVLAELAVARLGVDDLDEGYFAQQATRVLHGQVPLRDFETLYAPGLVYVHAALFSLFGGPSLVVLRVLGIVTRIGVAALLFALGRRVITHEWWVIAPALVVLVGLDQTPVRWEPHPGWPSTLFALLAVWCLTYSRKTRWLVLSGLAAAATYAFKQNTGLFVLLALVIWCRRTRPYVPLLSFAAATLVWLIPLALAVRDMRQLGVLFGAVSQASLVSAPEPTLLIPLGALLGGIWLARRDSNPLLRWYLLAGIALLLTQYPRADTLHLAWSAPLLLILGAAALDRAPAMWSAPVVAGVVLLLAPTVSSRVAYLALPRAPVAEVDAPLATATALNATVAAIQQHSAPGEPIFVYPTSPLLYVLADRSNPSRFDHLNPGAADPAQIDAVIAGLQLANVRVIVISDFWRSAWGAPGANAALEDWIAANYDEVASHGSYRVLLARL